MSEITSMQKIESYVLADPQLIMTVCDNVVNGGSLTELAKTWGVRYSDLYKWVVADEERNELYQRSLEQKKDFLMSSIIDELKYVGMADLSTIYDDNFNIKPVSQWPIDIKAAIGSIKKTINGIEIKKYDKLKALEMMGTEISMFSNKVEHTGKITLEALVASSMPPELKADVRETVDVTPLEPIEEEKNEEPEHAECGEEHSDLAF